MCFYVNGSLGVLDIQILHTGGTVGNLCFQQSTQTMLQTQQQAHDTVSTTVVISP